MPRTKETRNPLGTILPKTVTKNGKKIKVYDVRKRYVSEVTIEGKKIYKDKTVRCYSYAAAQTALINLPAQIEAEREQKRAKSEKKESYTFFDLTKYFRKAYCKEAVIVGDRQISGYRSSVKQLKAIITEFEEFFGDIPLDDITYEHCRAYAEHVATTPVKAPPGAKVPNRLPKAGTVNRKLANLRRLLNVGMRRKWMPNHAVNPFTEGEPLIDIGAETERERALTFDEERRLLEICEQEKLIINTTRYGKKLTMERENPHRHMKLILIMAIDTGLRRKEIFTLTRSEIDLETGVINLSAEKTKALKARQIPISARLENELRKHFQNFSFGANDFIFFGQKSCKKAFETICRYAGVKDLTFHDLRHTATTWMTEAGISEQAKMNIVGHATASVHRRYNNLTADVIDAVRGRMNDFRRRIETEAKQTEKIRNETKLAA